MRLRLFAFLLSLSLHTFAQSTVSTQFFINPPYTSLLQDYIDPSRNKMRIHIKLDDPVEAYRDVKLQFIIKSNDVILTTRSDFGPRLRLDVGLMVMHLGEEEEIAPYFQRENFTFQGNSEHEREFRQTGRLPEGFYEWKIEVLDYYPPQSHHPTKLHVSLYMDTNEPIKLL